ncbi:hypothetical protein EV126DRAFT_140381 [Verticillium dahliae]|nr:hypothetical protein EV126DRAFT_140381 [Verticillium dahliae]
MPSSTVDFKLKNTNISFNLPGLTTKCLTNTLASTITIQMAAGLPRGLNQCRDWEPMSMSLCERSRDNGAIHQEIHAMLEPHRQHRW